MIGLLESAASLGEDSGIEVVCERPVRTLSGNDWNLLLPNLHGQILFLDEENRFMKTREFAAAVRASDNYFVIITREDLPNLPYSVDEIYGIHTSGKYHDMKRTYNEMYRIYSTEKLSGRQRPDEVIVEDTNSGYEFFSEICSGSEIRCASAGGKSNLKAVLSEAQEENTLVIADGAAIGAEMNELYQLMLYKPSLKCYLPESFEWLILKSGIIDGKEVRDILNHPEEYIESQEYFSWERFFTAMLVDYTKDSYLKYSKSRLNKAYLHGRVKEAVLKTMEGIDFSGAETEK